MVYSQRPAGILGQKLERDLRFALPYHQMYNDQALVDDGPGRVAEADRKGAEDLANACFAGVGSDEDMFDIF